VRKDEGQLDSTDFRQAGGETPSGAGTIYIYNVFIIVLALILRLALAFTDLLSVYVNPSPVFNHDQITSYFFSKVVGCPRFIVF